MRLALKPLRAAWLASLLACGTGLLPVFAAAQENEETAERALPADPLGSPMWGYHAQRLFSSGEIVFDPSVKVQIPQIAENQREFPVTIDARALTGVVRIVVFADLNPIPVALEYEPLAAEPFIATRIKLDQRTPVRAAVLTREGTWHLAGQWIDAAGGGCSAPPVSRVRGDWAEHLGEMRAASWRSAEATRLRVAFRHPMDTGLVENIPEYALESLVVRGADGRELAHMAIQASVAEDPAFTLILHETGETLAITGRDGAGLEFTGAVPPGGA